MFDNSKMTPLKADILLLIISIIWGSTFIITKTSLASIPPVSFNAIRFTIASFLLFIIFLSRPKKLNFQLFRDGFILGIVLFLTFTFQTIGLKFVTASETGFITGLYLIFVPIISVIFLKKSVERKIIFAVLLAFIGLFLISFQGKLHFTFGEILVIANALLVAIHIILIDRYGIRNDVFALTSIQIFVLTILSILYALLFEDFNLKFTITSELIFAFFLTGVLATVVAFLVQTYAQKFTTPTRAAVIFTFEPLSSAFFGYLLGDEILTKTQYFGAFLIFISMLIVEIKFEGRKR
ncbi:MAG: DMT family transporter [Deferribacterales bacterium]